MLSAGSGLSLVGAATAAGREAGARAAAGFRAAADLALVFATFHHSADLALLARGVREATGAALVVAGTGAGVLTDEREIEGEPAVAVLAVASDRIAFRAVQVRAPDGEPDGLAVGRALAGGLSAPRAPGATGRARAVVLLPTPDAGPAEQILAGLDAGGLAGVPVFGAGLAGVSGQLTARTVVGDSVQDRSAAAVLLSGDPALAHGSSQAMGPVGTTHAVTRAHEDRIQELSGRPAAERLAEELGPTLWDGVRAGQLPVFLGLPDSPSEGPLARGRYLVRNLIGIDRRDGSLVCGMKPVVGDRVGFVVRNSLAARDELKAMLDRLASQGAGRGSAFGLYFNCCARGEGFHGVPDVDVSYIRSRFPRLPVAGVFGSFELAPSGGANRMHAYTGVLLVVADAAPAAPASA
jgi:small ligand-binding sensory domain FIST